MLAAVISVFALAVTACCAMGWRREAAARRREMRRADALGSDLRNVLDNLSSGLVIIDQRGIIQRLNPAAQCILMLDEEDALGYSMTDVFDEGLHDFNRALAQVLAGGGPVLRREIRILRGDGADLPVGVSVSPIEASDGALTGAVAIFQDLTDINLMRDKMRETDQLAAVGELSAGIAHEIRNPLASIRGSVEILAGELSLDEQERELMELILRESRRVNDIITDFLSFARTRPAQPKLVEMRPFLDDAVLQLRMHLEERGGETVVTHAVEPEDMLILMDAEQIKQVLLNLAMNGFEAMDYTGELTLTAELDAHNTACQITVADTGPGVPASSRASLFKPFFTERKGGTGLGLSVVKRIVHDHGGRVELASPPGGGAVFMVVLPLLQTPVMGVEPEAAYLAGR
ncbi:PAS domain S-box protein [bacterium]|nr:PAS domain S-box protein [bacterium]MBU1073650.1 PAS domain S-box protein [bacterium]MBU1674594.1 PAS domain S-box protein [bacterium]